MRGFLIEEEYRRVYREHDPREPETGDFEMADPYGHPRFYELAWNELVLYRNKNHDYTNGGDPQGNFKRVASILELYPGFPVATPTGVSLVYLLKQLDAVLYGLSTGTVMKVDSYEERLRDISSCAKLTTMNLEEASDGTNA
jgi:hypothetical protein